MQILTLSQLSQADPRALFAFLIAEDQLERCQALCQRHLGEQLPVKEISQGRSSLHVLGSRIALIVEMGPESDAEGMRQATNEVYDIAERFHFKELILVTGDHRLHIAEAIAESLVLSSYRFTTYKSKVKAAAVQQAQIFADSELADSAVLHGIQIASATCIARELVNEPVITLTAEEFATRIEKLGNTHGFETEIWHKAKIQAMQMGGILAVNAGSELPPTFSILTYKPENPINEKPIVLVGKGVVFDTGGLSLKPTTKSMDFMKSDMAGAAAVVGTLSGLAMLKSNYHVIGLIPATDNRPGKNAVVPGDVIRMYDGTTVEG